LNFKKTIAYFFFGGYYKTLFNTKET